MGKKTKKSTPSKSRRSPAKKPVSKEVTAELAGESDETDAPIIPVIDGEEDGLTASGDPNLEAIDAGLPDLVKRLPPKDPDAKALTSADPIVTYLADIRRYPLLTKEQEQELAKRYRETGDPKAAEMLVTSNLRFVVKIAAEYSKFGAKLIDLVQEGNVGLMHAVKEFNPYKGVRLITYAVWWIRGYIQEYLMRQYSLVRIGTTQNQRKLFYRLQKEKDLLDSMGHGPDLKLLSSRLGVSEEEVVTMQKRLSGRDVSLNQPLDPESNLSLMDFESSGEPGVDEQLGHAEEIAVLRQGIAAVRNDLTEKEKFILDNRVLSDEPMTLQEIGDHYGVTREAVRQIEVRLMKRIKTAFVKNLGEDEAED